MSTENFIPYNPRYDGSVDYIIRTEKYKDPEIKSQLDAFGVEVIEVPGKDGDCQSWAFEHLGLPEYAKKPLSSEELSKIGFKGTTTPSPDDLAVYPSGHYGLVYDSFHGIRRIISKLGINGAVCIHPENAFAGGTAPQYFGRT